jgi:arylsulfatase A
MAPDQTMDSASLLPLLLGEDDGPVHDFILYQAGYSQVGALRKGSWVLVVDENNESTELYDLQDDPSQAQNLIDVPEYAERIEQMRTEFLRYNDHNNATFGEPRTTSVFGQEPR